MPHFVSANLMNVYVLRLFIKEMISHGWKAKCSIGLPQASIPAISAMAWGQRGLKIGRELQDMSDKIRGSWIP